MRWKKESIRASLYLMKIHFLIIKLIIVKEFCSWLMKIFRRLTTKFNSNKF
jgi:hypothetical protein